MQTGGLPPVFFFVNLQALMEEKKKASFHENVAILVIGATIAGLFIKTLFF